MNRFNNTKRITSFALVIAMIFCMMASFAVTAFAGDEGQSELCLYDGKICYTAEDGRRYLLEYGDVYSMSSGEGDAPVTDYYYSDGFFFNDPETANSHLAALSLNLVQSCAMADIVHDNNPSDDDYRKSAEECFGRFAEDMGFGSLWISDDMQTAPTTTSVGFGFASKKLKDADGNDTGKTCIVIGIRSSGYKLEWVNNFIVGTTGNALGFGGSSQKVFSALQAYIAENNLTEAASDGSLCFWISGHSRGGCIANLTSSMIYDEYIRGRKADAACSLYSYCFANCCCGDPENNNEYPQIHNYIFDDDLVPRLIPALSDVTFRRFGKDIVLDRSAEGYEEECAEIGFGTKVGTSVALYYLDFSVIEDFSIKLTWPWKWYNEINDAIKSLENIEYDTFVTKVAVEIAGNQTRKYYLDDFYREIVSWYLSSRDKYTTVSDCRLSGQSGSTIEDALSFFIGYYFNISDQEKTDFTNFAEGITESKDKIISLVVEDIQEILNFKNDIFEWYTLTTSEKNEYINLIWNIVSELSVAKDSRTLTLKSITGDNYDNIKKSFPVIMDAALTCLSQDYAGNYGEEVNQYLKDCKAAGKTGIILGTLINNISNDNMSIVNPHYSEAYYASVRLSDSFRQNTILSLCGIEGNASAVYAAFFDRRGKMTGILDLTENQHGNIIDFTCPKEHTYKLIFIDAEYKPYAAKDWE